MLFFIKLNPDCPMDDDAIITEVENLEEAIERKRAANRYQAFGFKVSD